MLQSWGGRGPGACSELLPILSSFCQLGSCRQLDFQFWHFWAVHPKWEILASRALLRWPASNPCCSKQSPSQVSWLDLDCIRHPASGEGPPPPRAVSAIGCHRWVTNSSPQEWERFPLCLESQKNIHSERLQKRKTRSGHEPLVGFLTKTFLRVLKERVSMYEKYFCQGQVFLVI